MRLMKVVGGAPKAVAAAITDFGVRLSTHDIDGKSGVVDNRND